MEINTGDKFVMEFYGSDKFTYKDLANAICYTLSVPNDMYTLKHRDDVIVIRTRNLFLEIEVDCYDSSYFYCPRDMYLTVKHVCSWDINDLVFLPRVNDDKISQAAIDELSFFREIFSICHDYNEE